MEIGVTGSGTKLEFRERVLPVTSRFDGARRWVTDFPARSLPRAAFTSQTFCFWISPRPWGALSALKNAQANGFGLFLRGPIIPPGPSLLATNRARTERRYSGMGRSMPPAPRGIDCTAWKPEQANLSGNAIPRSIIKSRRRPRSARRRSSAGTK